MNRLRTGNGVLAVVLAVVAGGLLALGSAAVDVAPAAAVDASGTTRTAGTVGVWSGTQFNMSSGTDRVAALNADGGTYLASGNFTANNGTTYRRDALSNFGWDIPANATSIQIELYVKWRQVTCYHNGYAACGAQSYDTGSNFYGVASLFVSTNAGTSYGSALVERWSNYHSAPGATWYTATATTSIASVAALSNANFRVGVQARCKSPSAFDSNVCATEVDHVTATVTYTIPNTAPVVSTVGDSCAGNWVQGSNCTLQFTTTDAEGLSTGGSMYFCLYDPTDFICGIDGEDIFSASPNGASAFTTTDDTPGVGSFDLVSLNWGVGSSWTQTTAITWTIVLKPTLTARVGAWRTHVSVNDAAPSYDSEMYDSTVVAANTAPVISNFADSCSGEWIPTDTCVFSFRTYDADTDGLGVVNSAVVMCVALSTPGVPPVTVEDVTCVPDGVVSAAWAVVPDGDSDHIVRTAEDLGAGVNQSWAAVDVTRSANWSANTIDWTVTVRIGDIATASAEWNFIASVTDSHSAGSILETGKTVATSMVVKSVDDVDFGPLAPGEKSAPVDRSVEVRCNAFCGLWISTGDWVNDSTGGLISPQTNWGVDPGPGEFALACRRTDTPTYDPGSDVIIEGNLVGPSPVGLGDVSDPFDPSPEVMTLESQGNKVINCGVQNGQNALGVYRGAVVFTVGV